MTKAKRTQGKNYRTIHIHTYIHSHKYIHTYEVRESREIKSR